MNRTFLFATLTLLLLLPTAGSGQGSALRVLILDKNMSGWTAVVPTAEPWIRAGCAVDYRQHHPYLVDADIQRYQIIVLLGGRTPSLPSARFTRQDFDLLTAFLRQGGGLAVGYPVLVDGEGDYDRQALNQLLRELGAQVQIGDVRIVDTAHSYVTTADNKTYTRRRSDWPFSKATRMPLGNVTPIQISEDASVEVFLETYEEALFRKGKLAYKGPFAAGLMLKAGGPLLLAPRNVLANGRPGIYPATIPLLQPSASDTITTFLTEVVERFIDLQRGAELHLSPARPNSAIPTLAEPNIANLPALPDVPEFSYMPVETVRLGPEHLPDIEVLRLRDKAFLERIPPSPLKGLLESGLRLLNGRVTSFAIDGRQIVSAKTPDELRQTGALLQAGGFNLFWGIINLHALAGGAGYTSDEIREATEANGAALAALGDATNNWAVGYDFRDLRRPTSKTVGNDGVARDGWSVLDRGLWHDGFFKPLDVAASIAAAQPQAIPGIVLDLEYYGGPARSSHLMGYDFGDDAFAFFLAANRGFLPAALAREASGVPAPGRFAFLLGRGLLRLYYQTLQDEVERFAQTLRRRVARVAPNAFWAVYTPTLPSNWYTLGLLRGLSRPDSPVVLLTLEPFALRELAWLRDMEIDAVHAMNVSVWKVPSAAYKSLLSRIREQHHGFWMSSLEALLDEQGVRTGDGSMPLQEFTTLLKQSLNQSRFSQK